MMTMNTNRESSKNMNTIKINRVELFIFIVAIAMVPFFVLADEGHDTAEPHIDEVEVQTTLVEPEQFEAETEEDHEVGDGHDDHTHVVLPTIWWKSTSWWVLFISSLFLMTILSFCVYKYLEDKQVNKK